MKDSDPLQVANRRQFPWIVLKIIVGIVVLLAVSSVGWMLYMHDEKEEPTIARSLQEDNQEVLKESLLEPIAQGNLIVPEMVPIPTGSFRMGDIQGDGFPWMSPVRNVQINYRFAIGRYEVTFEEYDYFATAIGQELPNDMGWGRGHRPVINVSWQDAIDYAKWVSGQTSNRYRLPTEAEWEYIARAGGDTAYWWGNDMIQGMASCLVCGSQWDDKQTAPVGSFKPNNFGIHDTAGNVWEWTEDCWHENYKQAPIDGSAWLEARGGDCRQRVIRSGAWNTELVRSGNRFKVFANFRGIPGTRNDFTGFRLAQDLE